MCVWVVLLEILKQTGASFTIVGNILSFNVVVSCEVSVREFRTFDVHLLQHNIRHTWTCSTCSHNLSLSLPLSLSPSLFPEELCSREYQFSHTSSHSGTVSLCSSSTISPTQPPSLPPLVLPLLSPVSALELRRRYCRLDWN